MSVPPCSPGHLGSWTPGVFGLEDLVSGVGGVQSFLAHGSRGPWPGASAAARCASRGPLRKGAHPVLHRTQESWSSPTHGGEEAGEAQARSQRLFKTRAAAEGSDSQSSWPVGLSC